MIPWTSTTVASPSLPSTTSVIAAKDIPYKESNNRLQTLNVYLPNNERTRKLVKSGSATVPEARVDGKSYWLIYIHGGAWRDPMRTAVDIEPTVACIFNSAQETPIAAIASLNYTLSPHPAHPTDPYVSTIGEGRDVAREAKHPDHIIDVVTGVDCLRNTFDLVSFEYIIVGHSCGATLALQATLVPPTYWEPDIGISSLGHPAAILGLNGLYDLPLLVEDPDTHKHLKDVYAGFLNIAFGGDREVWKGASPALFVEKALVDRKNREKLPKMFMLDQSLEDQLVPINQTTAMARLLTKVADDGSRDLHLLLVTNEARGEHDEAWSSGTMIADIVLTHILGLLRNEAL